MVGRGTRALPPDRIEPAVRRAARRAPRNALPRAALGAGERQRRAGRPAEHRRTGPGPPAPRRLAAAGARLGPGRGRARAARSGRAGAGAVAPRSCGHRTLQRRAHAARLRSPDDRIGDEMVPISPENQSPRRTGLYGARCWGGGPELLAIGPEILGTDPRRLPQP